MFGHRPDGTLIRDLSKMRRFMPFISPRRNDSLVYFEGDIEVDAALRFVEDWNRDRPADRRMTFFQLYLRAVAVNFLARPGVNRFVAGHQLWQRKGLWITISGKKELVDGSKMITVKRRFDENETLEQMVDDLLEKLRGTRRGRKTRADTEMSLALRLPPFAIRAVMALLRVGNSLGMLPAKMIEDDPLFTTIFVANLGSLGMDPGYHHLWEYGTCSAFAMVGRIHERSDGMRVITCRYTYDERVEDGMYAGITLAGIKESIENPTKLA